LLILLLLVIIASSLFYFWQLNTASERNQVSAGLFEKSLLGSITQYDYIPSLLVKDKEIKQFLFNPEQSHIPLSEKLKFIAESSGVDDIYVLNEVGDAITTSNFLKEGSFLGKNYAFRPYFSFAREKMEKQYYFAKGVTTGVRGFFISEPIIITKNGKKEFKGVVVVKIVLDEWEQQWQSSGQDILVADSEQLYSEEYSVDYLSGLEQNIWTVNEKSYVVNKFPIKRVDWTLYHLDDQGHILLRTLWFLIFTLVLTAVVYLLWQERSSRLQLRREAREAERIRQAELQRVLDNIHIGVLVFDQQGKILSMNDHAEYLLDSERKIINNSEFFVQDLIEIDLQTAGFDYFLQSNIALPSYHETQTFLRKLNDGKLERIPVMFSMGKISHQQDIVYLMTVINITKRIEVEQELVLMNESLEEKVEQRTMELRATQAALMQKNRTTALGNMAATIVHELSQPLAAINSSVAAAQAKINKENWHGAAESMNRLSPLSKKMTNVIGLLKSYSYEDETLVEEIYFDRLVQQSIEVLKDRLQNDNIRIEYVNNCPDAKVRVNSIKIDLAISNLLKNAMDAVEGRSGAKIQVTIDNPQDGFVLLIVQDNGDGVDQAILDKLFNPYFTTKEVGRGMGLGLSITGEVIQEHDGTIDVKNTDIGACFRIHLPLHDYQNDEKSITNNLTINEHVN